MFIGRNIQELQGYKWNEILNRDEIKINKNEKKNKVIIIGKTENVNITIKDTLIEQVESFKYLEVETESD